MAIPKELPINNNLKKNEYVIKFGKLKITR